MNNIINMSKENKEEKQNAYRIIIYISIFYKRFSFSLGI